MFQSTPSKRKETQNNNRKHYNITVSIHSFQAEGDDSSCAKQCRRFWFQSTPSKRKETLENSYLSFQRDVSIHSFQAEGDISIDAKVSETISFNPLLPSGRRQQLCTNIFCYTHIYSCKMHYFNFILKIK